MYKKLKMMIKNDLKYNIPLSEGVRGRKSKQLLTSMLENLFITNDIEESLYTLQYCRMRFFANAQNDGTPFCTA